MKMTKEGLTALINEMLGAALGPLEERLRTAAAGSQQALVDALRGTVQRTTTVTREAGILFAQYVRSIAAGAAAVKNGFPSGTMDFAKRQYGAESEIYKALSSTNFSEGGALVPQQVATDIIPLLRPASVMRSLNPLIVSMPSGNMEMPKLTGGSTANYIGENQNIIKTEPGFGNVKLVAKKLAALIPMSNDWVRRATPQSDSVVRDDAVAALAQRSDLAWIRGDGTQFSPKGLRHWAHANNVIAANGTVNLANVTTDLGKLVLALIEANTRMTRPGWIFAPRSWNYLINLRDANGNFAFREEMLRGTLLGWPFRWTTQIPTNLGGGSNESEVYFADFADVALGETESLIVDISTEAAYHDGSNVVAAFSLDQTVLRVIQEHDLGLRQEKSIAVLTGVTWGV